MATLPKHTYPAPWGTPVLEWELDRDGDWVRIASWTPERGNRAAAHVLRAERNLASAWGEDLGRFRCPDAAREAADARLVLIGRLDESRAFVRLGEWEHANDVWQRAGSSYTIRLVTDEWVIFRDRELSTSGIKCSLRSRALADLYMVDRGWLDHSRAFKRGADAAPPPR